MKFNCGRLLILVALFALQACGGGAESDSHTIDSGSPQKAAPNLWVIMGSSSALGSGASAGHGWAVLLANQWASKDVEVKNIALGGSTTYHALHAGSTVVQNRPKADPLHNIDMALALKPKLLIISYPSNDTAAGYSYQETVSNLKAIRDMASKNGVLSLFLSTQPRKMSPDKINTLHEIDKALALEFSGCFVPVHASLEGVAGALNEKYDSGDGIHPNNNGHEVIFSLVQNTLNSGKCVLAEFR